MTRWSIGYVLENDTQVDFLPFSRTGRNKAAPFYTRVSWIHAVTMTTRSHLCFLYTPIYVINYIVFCIRDYTSWVRIHSILMAFSLMSPRKTKHVCNLRWTRILSKLEKYIKIWLCLPFFGKVTVRNLKGSDQPISCRISCDKLLRFRNCRNL